MNLSTKILLVLFAQIFFFSKHLESQTNSFPSSGSAGIGTTTPNASSALEIKSTTQGLLLSRMTKAQRDAIITPATGLMIYQTNSTPGFYYYSGTAWTAITQKPKGWSVTGNGGTVAGTNFIGTTDAQPLLFKVYNQRSGLIEHDAATANTSFGYLSLFSNTSANNTAFGYYALYSNSTGQANVANGAYALLFNTSDYNVATGFKALYSNTGGYANTATGFQTLLSNTDGILNTGTGSEALLSNTTGSYNTGTGYQSLFSNTTGADNTATGLDALHYNTTGSYNTSTGRDALRNNTTGYANTATGWHAIFSNTTGYWNTAEGNEALYSNTSGASNTACGYQSLFLNTSGFYNTAIGRFALYANTTNHYNTAIGYRALETNTTGSTNSALGAYADVSSGTLTNATAIGYFAHVDASDKIRLGNTSITSIGGQVGWTTFSDGRYKKNIKENVVGLSFIKSLRPITYTVDINGLNDYYNKKRSLKEKEEPGETEQQSEESAGKMVFNGFIAQEVDEAARKLNYEFSGVDKPQTKDGIYGLRYDNFVVPLVKAVQELSAKNDDLQKQIDDLKAVISAGNQNLTSAQSSKITSVNSSLEQNVPNPFSNYTVINYTLPETVVSAQIIIADQSGKVLKQVQVQGARKGSLRIDAPGLSSGTYQYSLLVNGNVTSTRQMVLTK
ncbi:MAG TPA: tail fiber domain-containing protein [Parafilimonas sp.]|nr:tail fiber domain-containing protein [Parafilimonas sp.]